MASPNFNDSHFWGNENASEYLINQGMEIRRDLGVKSQPIISPTHRPETASHS